MPSPTIERSVVGLVFHSTPMPRPSVIEVLRFTLITIATALLVGVLIGSCRALATLIERWLVGPG